MLFIFLAFQIFWVGGLSVHFVQILFFSLFSCPFSQPPFRTGSLFQRVLATYLKKSASIHPRTSLSKFGGDSIHAFIHSATYGSLYSRVLFWARSHEYYAFRFCVVDSRETSVRILSSSMKTDLSIHRFSSPRRLCIPPQQKKANRRIQCKSLISESSPRSTMI